MTRRTALPLVLLAIAATTAAFSTPVVRKWPPWISIEAPVNPYDESTRGAVLLVHASFREGQSQLGDVSGTAEGLVNGVRRTVVLRFASTGRVDTYALRRQWPAEGSWLAKINLRTTTALVTFDSAGNVASVRLPTEKNANGDVVPRALTPRDVDSALAALARR